MKNRDRRQLTYDLLKNAIDVPRTKTYLMYSAFLSTAQLYAVIDDSIAAGLLSKTDKRTYQTTKRGKKFVQMFEELQKLFDTTKLSLR